MTQYGVAKDGWWEGKTGGQVAALGGKDAQLLAFYLFKNPDDNMVGLYRARLPIIRERISTLTMGEIEQAFAVLARVDFAEYDRGTEHVWVHETAKYRLGLDRNSLKPDDNRAKHARGLYERAKDNPFLEPFYRRYRADLHLQKIRRFRGLADVIGRDREAPYQAPSQSEALTVAVADNSNQGDQERSADQDPGAPRRRAGETTTLSEVRGHVRSAIHAELDRDPDASDGELKAIGAHVAAKCQAVDYTSTEIGQQIDAVRGEREKRRA